MKAIGGLFEQITTYPNFLSAFRKAATGKRARTEVLAYGENLSASISNSINDIQKGEYRFSTYTSFSVRDTKSRLIHAPSFHDRVVHHAIINILGPVFEKGALYHSYACRSGKGHHQAIQQAKQWTRQGHWYGKMDVKKFYDSVDHRTLLSSLRRRFRERKLLGLFQSLLASYQTEPEKGLPIGALTSQYLGNFYLDQFDRKMKHTGLVPRYLRYMDDTVVWSRERPTEIKSLAREYLRELGLTLKNDGEWNQCNHGLPFLGFVIYPNRIRLNRQGRKRLRRKYHEIERLHDNFGSEKEVQERLTSLFAHACMGNDVKWRATLVSNFGEAPEPQPRQAGRLLEQHGSELPLVLPEQEPSRQSQQEPGVPGLSGSRHGGDDRVDTGNTPPDDALSRSLLKDGDKSKGKPLASLDTCDCESARKRHAKAPTSTETK